MMRPCSIDILAATRPDPLPSPVLNNSVDCSPSCKTHPIPIDQEGDNFTPMYSSPPANSISFSIVQNDLPLNINDLPRSGSNGSKRYSTGKPGSRDSKQLKRESTSLPDKLISGNITPNSVRVWVETGVPGTDTETNGMKIDGKYQDKASSKDDQTQSIDKEIELSTNETEFAQTYSDEDNDSIKSPPPSPPSSPTSTHDADRRIQNLSMSIADHTVAVRTFLQRKKRPELKMADFDVHHMIGYGSFAQVRLVTSRFNQKPYALKIVRKESIIRFKRRNQINSERSLLDHLFHPFVVTFWGSFQDVTNLYMIMDYLPGGELRTLIYRKKRLKTREAQFYAAEILLGLNFLHSQNIVHRDIKPENLLLGVHGHIQIADFGFAKIVPDTTATLSGTPEYIAPEMITSCYNCKPYHGKAVDWWSYGVVLYTMLSGDTPFSCHAANMYDNHLPVFQKILTGNIKWPSYFRPDEVDLIGKLLQRDPTKRLGSLERGAFDIMFHPWFLGIDFQKVLHCEVTPPYIPKLKDLYDTSAFICDKEDLPVDDCTEGIDLYKQFFPDF